MKVFNPSGMFIRLLAILTELEVFKRVNCYDSGRKSFFFRETRNSSILVLMTDVASISGRYSLGR